MSQLSGYIIDCSFQTREQLFRLNILHFTFIAMKVFWWYLHQCPLYSLSIPGNQTHLFTISLVCDLCGTVTANIIQYANNISKKIITIYFFYFSGWLAHRKTLNLKDRDFFIRVYSLIKLASTTVSRALSTLGLSLECPSPRRVLTKLKGPSYPIW
jgi:hypothetical protein